METTGLVQEHAGSSPAVDLLLVRMDEEIYALPSASVHEVVRYRTPTPVPGAPAALPGILNQRGAIMPVVDPRLLLGLGQPPITRAARLVIVAYGDLDMALLVDGVLDLVALPANAIGPVPPALDPARARMIRGVARHDNQPVILLDLGELVAGLRDWS